MRTKTALLPWPSYEFVAAGDLGCCEPSRTLAIPDSTAETWALASSKRAALLMYDGVGTWLFLIWIARFFERYVPGPIASGFVLDHPRFHRVKDNFTEFNYDQSQMDRQDTS